MDTKTEVKEVMNLGRKDRTEGVGKLTDTQRKVLSLYRLESKDDNKLEQRAKFVKFR